MEQSAGALDDGRLAADLDESEQSARRKVRADCSLLLSTRAGVSAPCARTLARDEHEARRPACSDACSARAKQASARDRSALSEVVPCERERRYRRRACSRPGAVLEPRLEPQKPNGLPSQEYLDGDAADAIVNWPESPGLPSPVSAVNCIGRHSMTRFEIVAERFFRQHARSGSAV
jgi:hypothetical protein